jgi:hypothetical protein
MSGSGTERRREKRITLPQPIVAKFGTAVVVVFDLSPAGALIEHYSRLDRGAKRPLRLQWGGNSVGISTEIVRSRIVRFIPGEDGVTVYRSGVRFDQEQTTEIERIRQTISKTIAATLAEQVANVRGFWLVDEDAMPVFREGMITTEDAELEQKLNKYLHNSSIVRKNGFYRLSLAGRRWTRKWTLQPEQPPHGFTVSAREPENDIRVLMETYLDANAEARDLIRILAAASIERESGTAAEEIEPKLRKESSSERSR